MSQAPVLCFHCGQPVPVDLDLQLQFGGASRALCCSGCLTVAQLIIDSGCSDFYLRRSAPSARVAAEQLLPEALLLADLPAARPGEQDAGAAELVFSVDGLRCAACVWLIEKYLARQPGVLQVELNVANARLRVKRDPARCAPSAILRGLQGLGYTAYPFDPLRQGDQARRAERRLFRQLFVAGLSMMQVMMYAVPAYLSHDGVDPDMMLLMRWASLLLTIPAVFYSALPFFAGAWVSLRARAPGMDVPVAIGIGAAFAGSTLATWRGHGEIYFDSVSMFIFLLLASRYLETIARRKSAGALERMQQALPAAAMLLAEFPHSRAGRLVAAAQLKEGDVILARPGDTVAADAQLIDAAELDLSLLSGESRPQHFQSGQQAPGGAVNVGQPALLRVTRATRDSTLAALTRLAEQAGAGKPALAQWADRVASRFVLALLLLAAASFLVWHFIDAERAWPVAVAVLVVSCPCALSLAMPSAMAAATNRLLREGTLVVRGNVLENLARADTIVFDKTGTLTQGRPRLMRVQVQDGVSESQVLAWVAAMEHASLHPLARALVDAAQQRGLAPATCSAPLSVAGAGMQCDSDGRQLRLGSLAFTAAWCGQPLPSSWQAVAEDGASSVYLADQQGWLARFDLADMLRPDALATVAAFRARGVRTILLSGDQHEVCDAVAATLGMDAVVAERSPQQKLAYVQALQAEGAVVAIVGDGINDAAMLRAADVSFAMGQGAALAQVSADAVIMSPQLQALADCATTATRTMRVVRQNLVWAAAYNLLAIPAAALGWISPWMSAVGMSLSSLLVVANALRLARGNATQSPPLAHSALPPQPALQGGH